MVLTLVRKLHSWYRMPSTKTQIPYSTVRQIEQIIEHKFGARSLENEISQIRPSQVKKTPISISFARNLKIERRHPMRKEDAITVR